MIESLWTTHFPALRGGWGAVAKALPQPKRGACILSVAALLLPGGLPVVALICAYRHLRARAADRRREE